MPTLFEVAEKIRGCLSCPLCRSRFLTVPGEGPDQAKLMFIGEAPGAEEDRCGKPFVGKSGKFLDQLFAANGIKREEVFITGAVKCHSLKNRRPTFKEISTCKKWLEMQIEIINPKIIVLMGQIAVKSIFGNKSKKVSELHGKVIPKDGRKYFITYHPAAGMRFPKIRKLIQSDFNQMSLTTRE